jgi:hypothetical protein
MEHAGDRNVPPPPPSEARGGLAETSSSASPSAQVGKTDLLMRLFNSEFFDEWIAIT